jgi:chloride channel 3/4/5
MQGLLGALLIKLNVKAAVYRRQNLAEWPVLEVVGAAAVTAALSYLVSQRIVYPIQSIERG